MRPVSVLVLALLSAGCSARAGSGFGSEGEGARSVAGDGGHAEERTDAGPVEQLDPPPSPHPDAGTLPSPQHEDAGSPPPPPPPPPEDSGAPGTFDAFQTHNLDVINQYRATLGIAPLALDPALCTFALAGATELSQDHQPHQHFINASNDGSIWMSGFNSQAGENQGDPNGWPALSGDPTQNELQQIDAIQAAMFGEGPGAGDAHGHYTNMMNAQFARLGVGLLEVSGQLYLTNDFSD